MITVDQAGQKLRCIRPRYTSPQLDVSLQQQAFDGIGELLYQRPMSVAFDKEGRQFFPEELLPPALVDHFVVDVNRYLRLVSTRHAQYCDVRTLMTETRDIVDARETDLFPVALCNTFRSYSTLLRFVHMGNVIVEEVYDRLYSVMLRIVTLSEANCYLGAILPAPAALAAAEADFYEDVRGSKKIEDVQSAPVFIFADPILMPAHPLDSDYAFRCLQKSIDLSEWWALRIMLPLVIQFAEEFRYADYTIRSHMKYILAEPSIRATVGYPYAKRANDILSALGIDER